MIPLLNHFQSSEYTKCRRNVSLSFVQLPHISWSGKILIPPNGYFSLIGNFSAGSSLLNHFHLLSLLRLFFLEHFNLSEWLLWYLAKYRVGAHLAIGFLSLNPFVGYCALLAMILTWLKCSFWTIWCWVCFYLRTLQFIFLELLSQNRLCQCTPCGHYALLAYKASRYLFRASDSKQTLSVHALQTLCTPFLGSYNRNNWKLSNISQILTFNYVNAFITQEQEIIENWN